MKITINLFYYFIADVDREDVCDMTLTQETAAEFELAVDRQVSIS